MVSKIIENVWIFYGILFIVSCALSLLLTPVFRIIAIALNVYDKPDEPRKIHTTPIPYLGGLAVIVSFFAVAYLARELHPEFYMGYSEKINGVLIGMGFLLILGLYDDIKKMNPLIKLLGQIAVASIIYFYRIRIDFITNPFGGRILFGIIDRYLITVFWIIFFMNAINLIDGLDGLAGGIVFISASAFFAIAVYKNVFLTAVAAVILAGSVLGFLFYNLPPAKIFLGDTGSMFLGYVLSILGLLGVSSKVPTVIMLIIPVIILFIPIYDTVIATARRLMAAKYVFLPDREHLHHKLLKIGFSPKAILIGIYLVSAFFAMVAIILVIIPKKFYGPITSLLILFIIMTALIFRALQKRSLDSHNEEDTDNGKAV